MRLIYLLAVLLFAGLCLGVSAQEGEDPAAPPIEEAVEDPPILPTEEEIKSEIEALEEAGVEADASVLASYKALLSLVEKTAAAKTKLTEYETRLSTLDDDLALAKKKLDASPPKIETVSGALSEEELEERVKQAKANYEEERRQLAALQEAEEKHAGRLETIPKTVAEAGAELEDLESKIAAYPKVQPETGDPDLTRLLLVGRRELLDTSIKALQAERVYLRSAEGLFVNREDLAKRNSEALGKIATEWRSRLDKARVNTAQDAATQAAVQAKDSNLPPEFAEIAKGNFEIAEKRTGPDGITEKITSTNREFAAETRLLQRIESNFRDAKDQVDMVESAGLRVGEKTGALLRKEGKQLPRIKIIEADVRRNVEELTAVRLQIIDLEKQRREEVSDLDGAVAALLARSGEGEAMAGKARELLTARRDHLNDLITDLRTYADTLREMLPVRRKLITSVEEFSSYIKQRIFWIRSAPPLHASDFSDGAAGLRQMASPTHWLEFLQQVGGDVLSVPLVWLLFLGAMAFLFTKRSVFKKRLMAAGEIASKRNCRSYAPTLKAIFYTLLIALPLPLIVFFLYWRSVSFSVPGDWSEMLCTQLRAIAFPITALAIARGVFRPKGLAQSHLDLAASKAKLLFRSFTWAMFLIIPLVFMRNGLDSLGFKPGARICFVLSMCVIAVFAFLVLRPKVGLLSSAKNSLGSYFAVPVYLFLLVMSLGLGVAAYLGYYYTVTELSWRIRASVWMILAVILVASIIMRLLVVSRRKVAFDQRVAAFRAAQKEKRKDAEGEGGEPPSEKEPSIEEIESELVDITKVREQAQSLIRMTSIFVIALVLWGVWVEVAPSLKVLDKVNLWRTADAAEQTSSSSAVPSGIDTLTGSSGKSEETGALEAIVPLPEQRHFVTLADLGLAILTLFLTYVAVRNIPGLLEITVLRRLKLKAGGAYAVKTVVRYIIVLVGIILAFAYIDVTWGKVQWIAAAITLGIGFGLQEIFANFVAGIILLFERPIRLGDFVTVGEVDGTVTQIRMRATTIRDRGNKELLVPNKEFITGQLVNWTLTDVMIRVEIPVGIAYGSDTQLAREELLRIGNSNRFALKEPTPRVVFMSFGASSLDFELRVFVRGADDLVEARSDLHFEIDRAFRKAGIEIAFPQQDLHIRSVPEGATVEGLTLEKDRNTASKDN